MQNYRSKRNFIQMLVNCDEIEEQKWNDKTKKKLEIAIAM